MLKAKFALRNRQMQMVHTIEEKLQKRARAYAPFLVGFIVSALAMFVILAPKEWYGVFDGDPRSYLSAGLAEVQARKVGSDLPLDRLVAAARGGHVDSQLSLGVRYYRGLGVIKDYDEAGRWFKLASANIVNPLIAQADNQGDVEAMRQLYRRYKDGVGVPASSEAALRWMLKLAEKEPPLDYGQFIDDVASQMKHINYVMVEDWLLKLATKGDVKAQYTLAFRLEKGDGKIATLAEAYAWYNIAASGGHTLAAAGRDRLGTASKISDQGQRRSRDLLSKIEKATSPR